MGIWCGKVAVLAKICNISETEQDKAKVIIGCLQKW